MKEKIDYKILKRFALGKYSLKDLNLVRHWFEDKSIENELKNAISSHWDEFSIESNVDEKDLTQLLDQLKHKIAFERPTVRLRINLIKIYSRAAAILLIPLLIFSVYISFLKFRTTENSALVEIVSPQGARTKFHLPDGSEGWLNSGSRIKYETSFLKERKVEIIGEVWFEVTHNNNLPFLVETKNLTVRVLGTKFNITAYPDEKITEVVLQEGKVKVNGVNGLFTAVLKPNEKFTFNKEQQTGVIQSVNSEQFSAWKDGLLVFRNEPLSEVLKRVGRWYNVKFIINDPEVANYKYRATFQEEQVEEVIRLISLTAPIEYSFDNREMRPDGIFKKRTITIRRKNN